MKSVLAVTLFLMSSLAMAQDGWKAVAHTTDCKDKIEVLAKTGEPYVLVKDGDKKIKLLAHNQKKFAVEGPESVLFQGDKYTYHHPSLIEANNPKITFIKNGTNVHCNMKAVK